MRQLLVNAPGGVQQLIEVDVPEGVPAYFDYSLVLWDTAQDGELPDGIQLGGMERVVAGGVPSLQFDSQLLAASQAAHLVTLQAQAWDAIKARRDSLSNDGGYMVAVDGIDKWFHSDVKSRTQQLGLVMMGASVPAVEWKTMDGTFVSMTQALASAIFQAAAAQEEAIFAKAEQHRQAMMQAADPLAYDYTTGWPATFTGAAQ